MEHVVFFPAPDGTPAFRRVAGLEEAVRFVEHLRNVENVSGASVHTLTEVPLSFKAWYRVELPGAQDAQLPVEAPAARPATIADAIETYTQPVAGPSGPAGPFELPDTGSATGIVVPDQPFVAVDQFSAPPVFAPAMPAPLAPALSQAADQAPAPLLDQAPAPLLDQAPVPAPGQTPGQTEPEQAQVLEPAFGVRRERGLGFFTR